MRQSKRCVFNICLIMNHPYSSDNSLCFDPVTPVTGMTDFVNAIGTGGSETREDEA